MNLYESSSFHQSGPGDIIGEADRPSAMYSDRTESIDAHIMQPMIHVHRSQNQPQTLQFVHNEVEKLCSSP